MTEATIRGVAGMKSVLDMPVMQVRIGLIIKSFNTIHLRAFCIFRCASHKMCASRVKKMVKRDSIRKSLRFAEDEYEE